MGSFNETCALSNLNVGYGTPVKLLFLTQNPYIHSDDHEAQRGCYHYDQWFVRTPPIAGKYADYGRCEFDEGPLTDLIVELFKRDAIRRPFGFNQYHAPHVDPEKGIHHLLNAAWEGRLLVRDGDQEIPEPPEEYPTWQRVHQLLKKARKPLQLESKNDEGKAGYNAQPVSFGIVAVHFNSYNDNSARLKSAQEVLKSHYDCKILYKFNDRKDDPCLIVTRKGALKNPSLLANIEAIKEQFNTHPEMLRNRGRQLPVLAVMVREDVWDAYAQISAKAHWGEKAPTVDSLRKKLEEAKKDLILSEMAYREVLVSLPFQTTPATHLVEAVKNEYKEKNKLLQSVAELARIEYVMACLHQPWYIPPLGGQEGNWELRTKLLKKITDISAAEYKREREEYEDG